MVTTENVFTTVAPVKAAEAVPAKPAAPLPLAAPAAKVATKVPTKKVVKKPAVPAEIPAVKTAAGKARKTVAKTAAKPVVKAPAAQPVIAAAGKPVPAAVLKPVAPAAAKPMVTLGVKPVVKANVPPKAAKPGKEKKTKAKLLRDSFNILKAEYSVLGALKQRAGKLGSPVKKSGLLRAGIKALAAMADSAFLAALKAVPAIKTGRRGKA